MDSLEIFEWYNFICENYKLDTSNLRYEKIKVIEVIDGDIRQCAMKR